MRKSTCVRYLRLWLLLTNLQQTASRRLYGDTPSSLPGFINASGSSARFTFDNNATVLTVEGDIKCYWNDEEFSNGDRVSSEGKTYEASNGTWVEV